MNRGHWPGDGRRLLVVVGPSGAGKDAVLDKWLARLPADDRPHRARRTITRPADVNEAHEPLDVAGFEQALARGQFAIVWRAHGLYYGVRWHEFAPLAHGQWVVLNGSRAHLPLLRTLAPALRVVEVTAPAALRAHRLGRRAREAGADRAARLAREVGPVDADCRVHNTGALNDAVDAWHRWWTMQGQEELR